MANRPCYRAQAVALRRAPVELENRHCRRMHPHGGIHSGILRGAHSPDAIIFALELPLAILASGLIGSVAQAYRLARPSGLALALVSTASIVVCQTFEYGLNVMRRGLLVLHGGELLTIQARNV